MTPRKSHWIFLVVGLASLCLLLAAPAVRATQQHGEPGSFHPGVDCILDPPSGGPTGTGGGEGGDPDDYSNLLRLPNDPSVEPVSGSRGARTNGKPEMVWTEPMLYAVLIWLGIER